MGDFGLSAALITFAEEELDLIGIGEPDADYDGALKPAVLEIVQVFSKQGHSGMSASMVTSMVEKLMRYEPLSALTGADDEWGTSASPDQNRRCFHVFRRPDGTAFDTNGRIFRDPNGICFTSGDSHVDVTFPYVPTREYVEVDEAGEPSSPAERERHSLRAGDAVVIHDGPHNRRGATVKTLGNADGQLVIAPDDATGENPR